MQFSKNQKIGLGVAIGVASLLVLISAIFHERIISWLIPYAQGMANLNGAFLIPSILMVFVSFPPLFGHEAIAILTGFVYGKLLGFLIVVLSSLLGETLLFLSFRYFLRRRIADFREKHRNNYGVFVQVVEQGGFPMLMAIRLSAIPSHFSTPLFASIDTLEYKRWLLAALASSFKYFPPVYIGDLLRQQKSSKVTQWVFGIALIVTIGVVFYIYIEYTRIKRDYERTATEPDDDLELGPETEQNLLDDVGGAFADRSDVSAGMGTANGISKKQAEAL